MFRWCTLCLLLILILALPACNQSGAGEVVNITKPPANCPVTKSPDPPFTPPQPYPASAPGADAWYGTAALWTRVPQNGIWEALSHNSQGYSQKVFWWRAGYDMMKEPEPNLTVTGHRLDGEGFLRPGVR